MGRKSAYFDVVSKFLPVKPSKCTKRDCYTQPKYYRSRHAQQTSRKLLAFQGCMRNELQGKKFPSQKAVRENFTAVAKACKLKVAKIPRVPTREEELLAEARRMVGE